MELKRRLNAVAKRCDPEIQASNTGTELGLLTDRLEELLDYAEEKVERRKERDRTGKPASVRQLEKAKQAERDRAKLQDEQQQPEIDDQAEAQPVAESPPDPAEDENAGAEPAQTEEVGA